MSYLNAEWGKRIRHERLLRNWTQSDLAWALGVTKSCIAHIESGRTGFSEERKLELASAFNMQVKNLFTYPDPFFTQRHIRTPKKHTSRKDK